MPNTLAHIGVQALATRSLLPRAEPHWILLGCVLPDLPWILQRLAGALAPGLDPYALRVYAVVQSSLVGCLLLAAAVSTLARRPGPCFGVLALGALLHLLLDALQQKPGNGVHLLAPLSWELLHLDLFRIESLPTLLLTAAGAVGAAWALRARPVPLAWARRRAQLGVGLLGLLLYAALPLALDAGARAADVHFVRTLQEREARAGRPIAFDRVRLRRGADGPYVVTWAGERIALEGARGVRSGEVSLRGRFVATDTIRAELLYGHWPAFRPLANAVGLGVVALAGLRALRAGGPARADGDGGR